MQLRNSGLVPQQHKALSSYGRPTDMAANIVQRLCAEHVLQC